MNHSCWFEPRARHATRIQWKVYDNILIKNWLEWVPICLNVSRYRYSSDACEKWSLFDQMQDQISAERRRQSKWSADGFWFPTSKLYFGIRCNDIDHAIRDYESLNEGRWNTKERGQIRVSRLEVSKWVCLVDFCWLNWSAGQWWQYKSFSTHLPLKKIKR